MNEGRRNTSMGETIIDACHAAADDRTLARRGYGRAQDRRAAAGGSYCRKSNSQPSPESFDPRTLGSIS